jgi:hypothetical protein
MSERVQKCIEDFGKVLPGGPRCFTTDCPYCDGLIFIEDGVLYDFHKKLHEEDPRWPEDGMGTSYLSI